MKAIFITGTDTGVGKTLVTGLLARYFLDKGKSAITQKWVQSGSEKFPRDIATHLKLMGKNKSYIKNNLSDVCLYVFKLAASPHLAAVKERKSIRVDEIKRSLRALGGKFDWVIVEGVGGALVPLNKNKLVIDIVKELKLPILVVVGNKLGAINHTLLTIEALKRRKIKILGLVFNNLSKKGNKTILENNPKIIEAISKEKVLGILPYSKNKELLYKKFVGFAKKSLQCC